MVKNKEVVQMDWFDLLRFYENLSVPKVWVDGIMFEHKEDSLWDGTITRRKKHE